MSESAEMIPITVLESAVEYMQELPKTAYNKMHIFKAINPPGIPFDGVKYFCIRDPILAYNVYRLSETWKVLEVERQNVRNIRYASLWRRIRFIFTGQF